MDKKDGWLITIKTTANKYNAGITGRKERSA